MNAMTREEVKAAMEMLVRGYEEELNLYGVVRSLTLRQKALLSNGRNTQVFRDLLDEKEDVLQLISQMEHELRPARRVVMSADAPPSSERARLARLLDRLTALIEETRLVEMENVELIEAATV